MQVTAFNSTRYVNLGETDEFGSITMGAGTPDGQTTVTGTYTFSSYDNDPTRDPAGTAYASTEKTGVAIVAGDNDLGTVTLQPGGTVSGVATAPSGHVLGGLGYMVLPVAQPIPTNPQSGNGTDPQGQYSANRLAPGDYKVAYQVSGSTYRPSGTTFTIPADGGQVTADIHVRVSYTHRSLTGSSATAGSERIVYATDATRYQITSPGSFVTFYDGSTAISKPITLSSKGTAIFTRTGRRSGKHLFKAVYSPTAAGVVGHDGDLLANALSATFTVT